MIAVSLGDGIHQYRVNSSTAIFAKKISAIAATEMVEGAFVRARNAVLRCSDRINERVLEGIPLLDLHHGPFTKVSQCLSAVVLQINRLIKPML